MHKKYSFTTHAQRSPRWLKLILLELWPFIILILALVIELGHIATSGWIQAFLYNSDSLTLPLIQQSLMHKEPFLWVFSSQFFLFPEGLFYAVAAGITDSIRSALVFSAFLNMVVLYALIRLIAAAGLRVSRTRQQLAALGCCLLLIFYMLLERQPLINQSAIATLFLFTSYYYGVVLAGLFSIYIAIRQFNLNGKVLAASKQNLFLVGLAFVVSGLTTFSNPLYIVQFLVPLLVVLFLMVLLNALSWRKAYLAGIPQVAGSILGYILRKPFIDFVGQSLGTHILTQDIPATLSDLHASVSASVHHRSGRVEFVLCFGVILFCAFYALRWIYLNSHTHDSDRNKRPSVVLFFLCTLSAIEAACVVIVSIVTGSMTTRYLLPMFIFPLLGLFPFIYIKLSKCLYFLLMLALAILFAWIIILGLSSIHKANILLSSSYSDSLCLAKALDDKAANGVAEYWTARPIDVYGMHDERVLQINPNFTIYPWLANLGAYSNKSYSFVIVDKSEVNGPTYAILPNDPSLPSSPSYVSNCQDMFVYQYSPGSSGYKALNTDILRSYRLMLRYRSTGQISKYL